MAEKIHAGKKRRSRSDAISYLCTQKCQCLPNYYSGLLIKEIKSTTNSQFHKSSCQGNSTTLPTNNNNLASHVEEIIASDAAKVVTTSTSNGSSHGLMELQVQGLKKVPKFVSFVPKNQEIAPPDDEQSQTVGPIKARGKADDNIYYDEPLSESSSLYSLHASNNTSDNYEEPGDDVLVKDKLARKGPGIKRRRRNAEIHNLHEKKRRDEINKKMLMLKDLIPNCNKMDKASMLDDAIEYLKALKCQLQIMSMSLRMPLMMIPTATPHMMMMYTPHLHQLMGFRSSLPVINDNNGVQMFGFPNQMPPMPISHPAPMIGNPSIQQPLLAKSSTATKMAENQASSQFTMQNTPSSS